jgi:hypothetical protein
MSELSIGIKIKENNFKISLHLMTVQMEDKMLSEVWTGDGNRGGAQIPSIHIDLKTLSEIL